MFVICIVCTHHSSIFLGHFDAGEANSLKCISFLQLLYLHLVSPGPFCKCEVIHMYRHHVRVHCNNSRVLPDVLYMPL